MPAFRLLHCSDLHFGAPHAFLSRHDQTLAETLARVAVRGAFAASDRLDRILVTGDVATAGSSADLSIAKAFFEPPLQAGTYLSVTSRPTLGAAAPAVALMPGNHDRYDDVTCAPGGKQFDRVFSHLWKPLGATWPHDRVAVSTCEREGHSLHFVSLDLTLRSERETPPFLWLGWGNATLEVLELAKSETLRLRDAASAVIWLVHFPPHAKPALQLLGKDALLIAMRDAGVRLALFGHTHAPHVAITDDLMLATASTATELDLSGATRRSFNFYKVSFDASDPELIIEPWEIDTTPNVLGRRPLHTRRLVRFPSR